MSSFARKSKQVLISLASFDNKKTALAKVLPGRAGFLSFSGLFRNSERFAETIGCVENFLDSPEFLFEVFWEKFFSM